MEGSVLEEDVLGAAKRVFPPHPANAVLIRAARTIARVRKLKSAMASTVGGRPQKLLEVAGGDAGGRGISANSSSGFKGVERQT